jgi:hypothetical protein
MANWDTGIATEIAQCPVAAAASNKTFIANFSSGVYDVNIFATETRCGTGTCQLDNFGLQNGRWGEHQTQSSPLRLPVSGATSAAGDFVYAIANNQAGLTANDHASSVDGSGHVKDDYLIAGAAGTIPSPSFNLSGTADGVGSVVAVCAVANCPAPLGPAQVQSPFTSYSSVVNSPAQQCSWTFPAIATGDTVVGYIHVYNSNDTGYMAPNWIHDNNGTNYTMTASVNWNPWNESVTVFYLHNVTGNPTSFTIDLSQYPNSGSTILGHCDTGFTEYSGVSGVSVLQAPTNVTGTTPSITVSPPSGSRIWALAAVYGNLFSLLQNTDYTGIINNFTTDDFGVWHSTDLPSGSQTLTWNAPLGGPSYRCGITNTGCPSLLAAVALQPAGARLPAHPQKHALGISPARRNRRRNVSHGHVVTPIPPVTGIGLVGTCRRHRA